MMDDRRTKLGGPAAEGAAGRVVSLDDARAPRRRALVTGAAGFLGSHLSEHLLDDGWEVVGVDCFTDYYPRARKEANLTRLRDEEDFDLLELDLASDPVTGLVDGVDAVFHLAAQAGVRGSFGATFADYVHNNVSATQRLLEETVRAQTGTFVYASSSSVYGDAEALPTSETAARRPVSPYGMTKVATEELAGVYSRTHGLRTVGLRYFTAYGPRQRPDMAFSKFIAAALDGRPITILGDGMQIRDFTYVDDVVRATAASAGVQTPGAHVFNVGGGSPVPLVHVLNLLERIVERPLALDHRDRQVGDARHTAADTRLAAAALGFAPTTSLEEGLRAQVEYVAGERGATRLAVAA
jgi:nucleoside-diphosphate-sugar epimerase